MAKKIVCYCQDLTESDLIRAIEEGYDHMELLKRYTGAFMGPCQGKMCALNVLKVFAENSQTLHAKRSKTPVQQVLQHPEPGRWGVRRGAGEEGDGEVRRENHEER